MNFERTLFVRLDGEHLVPPAGIKLALLDPE
jgi:hypothetical protein